MKLSTCLTALTLGLGVMAEPILLQKRGAFEVYEKLLNDISNQLNVLGDALEAYTGGSAIPIVQESTTLIQMIDAGTRLAEGQPELTQSEVMKLVPGVTALGDATKRSIAIVIEKKQLALDNGVASQVKRDVTALSEGSARLAAALVNGVPDSLKSLVTSIGNSIQGFIQPGIDAYADVFGPYDVYKKALADITAKLNHLADLLDAYTGGPGTEIIDASAELVKTILDGAALAANEPMMGIEDTLALVPEIGGINIATPRAIQAIIDKKQLAIENGLASQVKADLHAQAAASAELARVMAEGVHPDVKSVVEIIGQNIQDFIAPGIEAYSDVPDLETPTTTTAEPTVTPTPTPTPTPTDSESATPTDSATETGSPSTTDSDSVTPTDSATETDSASPTESGSVTPTGSATETGSASHTDSGSSTPTGSATETGSSSPTGSGSAIPTNSATETGSAAPTGSGSAPGTASPTGTDGPAPIPTDDCEGAATTTVTVTVTECDGTPVPPAPTGTGSYIPPPPLNPTSPPDFEGAGAMNKAGGIGGLAALAVVLAF